jgi:hypothetical protein
MGVVKSKALPDRFKGWVVASLGVLLASLVLVLGAIVASFVYFSDKTSPLWVTLLGVAGALGVGLGFAGLVGLMAVAGWREHRESKRVQVMPPRHDGGSQG